MSSLLHKLADFVLGSFSVETKEDDDHRQYNGEKTEQKK